MLLRVILCFLIVFCTRVQSNLLRAKLPTYLDQCKLSDPNLNACFVWAANRAISRIVKGDIHYNIPSMLPLLLQQVVVRNDAELQFTLNNVQVYGLENSKVTAGSINIAPDLSTNSFEQTLTNPKITILGNYHIRGRILNVPINGNGRANITIVNGNFIHGFSYVFDKELYPIIGNDYVKYTPQLVIYQFDNLFPEHGFLGYQTNAFLNNNWKAVSASFQPGSTDAMKKFLSSLFAAISAVVPLNEIFSP